MRWASGVANRAHKNSVPPFDVPISRTLVGRSCSTIFAKLDISDLTCVGLM